MNPTDLDAAATPVLEAFDRLGIRWYVGGSVASSLLGNPRSTLDLDLVAEIESAHATALVSSLEGEYYIEESMILDAVRRGASFNLVHLDTVLKIDVFVRGPGAWERKAMSRRGRNSLQIGEGAREVWVASAEDMILSKLKWFRDGGEASDRQWNDILGVLRVQATAVDREYLTHWASELGVADLLARATTEA